MGVGSTTPHLPFFPPTRVDTAQHPTSRRISGTIPSPGLLKRLLSPSGGLPLLPIAPVLIAVLGVAAAVTIAIIGISQLSRISDVAAEERAAVLADTVAARLRYTPTEDRSELLQRAAQRSATEFLLVDQNGQIVINHSFGQPDRSEVLSMLVNGRGETKTETGRARFATKSLAGPLSHLSLVAMVEAPSPPPGSITLLYAVAVLTVLFMTIAVAVVFGFIRATRDEVVNVRTRIAEMADTDANPAGKPLPVPTLDQVGVLITAFNLLVTRFSAAERSYRADLNQAKEIHTERSAFLAGLSHELRTPLNAILGFAHVLETEVDGPLSDDAKESTSIIRTSGEHLRTLIDDILDLSAMETGQLQLSRREVDIRRLAEQVVKEARATVQNKPLMLGVSGGRELRAYADKRRVRQILTNLISNAIKFTKQGSVTVNIEDRHPEISITVADTGPGIAPDQTESIFVEYQQAGDSRSRRAGTGLGLAMVKRLVNLHGGQIEVRSELGRGSQFVFTLPAYTGEAVAEVVDPLSVIDGPEPRASLTSMPPPIAEDVPTKSES